MTIGFHQPIAATAAALRGAPPLRVIAEVKKALRPEDGLWVICLGHCHHDGRQAWWNLPGPDITAAEFGKLFADEPAAIARTLDIAARCTFTLGELRYRYPGEALPDGKDASHLGAGAARPAHALALYARRGARGR